MAVNALKAAGLRVIVGPTWTTDAPFRETAEAIEAAKRRGILAVEMEAAALYTFARARQAKVLCIAHVTNTMGQAAQDFEKGEAGRNGGCATNSGSHRKGQKALENCLGSLLWVDSVEKLAG